MSRSVVGQLKEDPEVVVQKLRRLAKKNNIKFEGDECTGKAEGKGFVANYRVEGRECTLTVTKKPMLVPWGVVEKAIAKVFDR